MTFSFIMMQRLCLSEKLSAGGGFAETGDMGGEEIFAVVPAMKIAGLKKQGKASVFRDDENFAIHDKNVAVETMLKRDPSDRIIRVFHSPILHYLLLYGLHQMQAVDQGRG